MVYEELLVCMDMFIILNMFVVSWMYTTHVKIYYSVHFKYVHLNVCQFHLNKDVRIVKRSVIVYLHNVDLLLDTLYRQLKIIWHGQK